MRRPQRPRTGWHGRRAGRSGHLPGGREHPRGVAALDDGRRGRHLLLDVVTRRRRHHERRVRRRCPTDRRHLQPDLPRNTPGTGRPDHGRLQAHFRRAERQPDCHRLLRSGRDRRDPGEAEGGRCHQNGGAGLHRRCRPCRQRGLGHELLPGQAVDRVVPAVPTANSFARQWHRGGGGDQPDAISRDTVDPARAATASAGATRRTVATSSTRKRAISPARRREPAPDRGCARHDPGRRHPRRRGWRRRRRRSPARRREALVEVRPVPPQERLWARPPARWRVVPHPEEPSPRARPTCRRRSPARRFRSSCGWSRSRS